jgi:aspartate 1-decarboxylase
MRRSLFKSKIHRCRVTQADVDYEGSVTIDSTLMEAAEIVPFEHVHIWNVTRGTRLETYALRGEPDSGVICINGAAAHLMHPGDLVIIATFADVDDAEARGWKPRVVLVDEHNRVRATGVDEVPGPKRRD